jgi:hypothetical protein
MESPEIPYWTIFEEVVNPNRRAANASPGAAKVMAEELNIDATTAATPPPRE